MKAITDTINESKTNLRQIEQYVKSWITGESDAFGYEGVLRAIQRGLQAGCDENKRYLKDDNEQQWLEVLDDVITDWDVPSAKLGGWDK